MKRRADELDEKSGEAGGVGDGSDRRPRRRKSRFSDAPVTATQQSSVAPAAPPATQDSAAGPPSASISNVIAQASARAAALAASRAGIGSGAAPPPLGGVGLGLPGTGIGGVGAAGGLNLSAMQAQIQQSLALLRNAKQEKEKEQEKTKDTFVPPPLLLDNKGRQVDEKGHVIQTEPSAMASVVKPGVSVVNPYLKHLGPTAPATSANAATVFSGGGAGAGAGAGGEAAPAGPGDDGARPRGRKVRELKFVEEGTYVTQAEKLRDRAAKAEFIERQRGLGSRRKPTVIEDTVKEVAAGADGGGDGAGGGANHLVVDVGAALGVHVARKPTDVPIPDIEWWDAALLPSDRRKARAEAEKLAARRGGFAAAIRHVAEDAALQASYADLSISNAKTHTLVEHPVPIAPVVDKDAPKALPLMPTVQERKKMRRRRRADRLKEQQDLIRAEIIPPPEPKVKLSNLARVLGEQAAIDPTKMEAYVKKQMEERQHNHEMRNQARKLTPAERKAKVMAKNLKGTKDGVSVALFFVTDLSDKQHRFKVDVNAQENHLTGSVVLCEDASINLVVVEGGPRPIKKYIRLMTHRIDWSNSRFKPHDPEASSDEDGEAGSGKPPNRCELVWQGIVPTRTFSRFGFEKCSTTHSARRLMHTKGLAHYWDMVMARAGNMDATGSDAVAAVTAAGTGGGGAGGVDDLEALLAVGPDVAVKPEPGTSMDES